MALGAFRFSLSTAAYQSFRHRVEHRWVRNDEIGGPPRHQYLGSGEQTIILQGVIYPHHKGGLHQIVLMQAQASLGVPLYLVDGTGHVWGNGSSKRLKRSIELSRLTAPHAGSTSPSPFFATTKASCRGCDAPSPASEA